MSELIRTDRRQTVGEISSVVGISKSAVHQLGQTAGEVHRASRTLFRKGVIQCRRSLLCTSQKCDPIGTTAGSLKAMKLLIFSSHT